MRFEIKLRGGPGVYRAGRLAAGVPWTVAWMKMFRIEALIERRDDFIGAEA